MTLWKPIILGPLLAAFLLTGCDYSGWAIGYIDNASATAVEQARQANDAEARLYRNAPCAMRIGSFLRTLNTNEQISILSLCGATQEEAINLSTAIAPVE